MYLKVYRQQMQRRLKESDNKQRVILKDTIRSTTKTKKYLSLFDPLKNIASAFTFYFLFFSFISLQEYISRKYFRGNEIGAQIDVFEKISEKKGTEGQSAGRSLKE